MRFAEHRDTIIYVNNYKLTRSDVIATESVMPSICKNTVYDCLSRLFFGWSIPARKKIDSNIDLSSLTPGNVKALLLSLFPKPRTLYEEKNQRLCSTMLEHALPLIFASKKEGELTFSFIQEQFKLSSLIALSFSDPQPALRPELIKMWLRQLPGGDLENLKSGELPRAFYQAFEAATKDLNQALTLIIAAQSLREDKSPCRG